MVNEWVTRPRCLDLTRLLSRVGRGPLTGVDRVESAYLRQMLEDPVPFFVLARTVSGYVLLDRDGARQIAARLAGNVDWGPLDLIGRVTRKASKAKRRAEADLRRHALDRCGRHGLPALLRRRFPRGCTYFNVGHSNLTERVLSAWSGSPETSIWVLVHDMIPLDYPEFQRPGTPHTFERKMRVVARFADRIICNSGQTERDVQRWFSHWGARPDTLVAHLGIDLPTGAAGKPLPRPLPPVYFVTLGTIEPRKNHALLLDIWDEFARDLPPGDIPHLIIAGSRGWANEAVFRRLDTSHLIGRCIHEWPGLDDGQIVTVMKGAAGVLFPSLAEGFGLPPAEAIALGSPVICGNLPVYEEILGNIPVYVESGDVYSWKQSITRLADIKRAGQNNILTSTPEHRLPTWDDHFNLVLEVN